MVEERNMKLKVGDKVKIIKLVVMEVILLVTLVVVKKTDTS